MDKVTNAALLYDWELVAPVYERLMITDAALLTLPASKSIEPENLASAAAWEPIWNGIHQSFGVRPDELKVNFAPAELHMFLLLLPLPRPCLSAILHKVLHEALHDCCSVSTCVVGLTAYPALSHADVRRS